MTKKLNLKEKCFYFANHIVDCSSVDCLYLFVEKLVVTRIEFNKYVVDVSFDRIFICKGQASDIFSKYELRSKFSQFFE